MTGSELLGSAGAKFAVPTVAIVQVLFEELYLMKDPVEAFERSFLRLRQPPGFSALSVAPTHCWSLALSDAR